MLTIHELKTLTKIFELPLCCQIVNRCPFINVSIYRISFLTFRCLPQCEVLWVTGCTPLDHIHKTVIPKLYNLKPLGSGTGSQGFRQLTLHLPYSINIRGNLKRVSVSKQKNTKRNVYPPLLSSDGREY
jgi:hypothetical protein